MSLKDNFITLFITSLIFFNTTLHAQRFELLTEGQPTSLRGLCAVTDNIIWVSGSKGTVGKSLDGGKTWSWTIVKGFETREFRDIEAFDHQTAVIIAVAEPAHILRTTDGGATWNVVYENKTKGMFLDAMDFFDDRNGTVVGDPIDGKFFVAHTTDGGLTWKEESTQLLPKADSGEAFFASSGTNIYKAGKKDFVLVSGGKRSRVFSKNKSTDLPFATGLESAGANSLAVRQIEKTSYWIVVGGDFVQDTVRTANCFISTDQGKTWNAPAKPPYGYRSCVEFMTDNFVIACGVRGVDISGSRGKTWEKLSGTGFHVCQKAKKGNIVYLAGSNGRIGRIIRILIR